MGEYEPDDSRKVTQSDHRAPGEPPRTGPREDDARRQTERDDSENAADGRPVNREVASKDAKDDARVRDAGEDGEALRHKL